MIFQAFCISQHILKYIRKDFSYDTLSTAKFTAYDILRDHFRDILNRLMVAESGFTPLAFSHVYQLLTPGVKWRDHRNKEGWG